MSISAKQFDDIVKKWAESPRGKAHILKETKADTFNDADLKKIAIELRNAIITAYLNEIKTENAPKARYYDMSTVDVKILPSAKDGRANVQIIFKGEGLWRDSLLVNSDASAEGNSYLNYYGKKKTHDSKAYYTGKGVYDIIGLFTQGYETEKAVYGNWTDPRTGHEASWQKGRVKNLTRREGSSFVTDVIKAFEKRYPFLEISYPALWGGTSKPSGNWRKRPNKG